MNLNPQLTAGSVASLHIEVYYLKADLFYKNRNAFSIASLKP
jgi:hypothetical protein